MASFSFLKAVKSQYLSLLRLFIAAEEVTDSRSSAAGHDFSY